MDDADGDERYVERVCCFILNCQLLEESKGEKQHTIIIIGCEINKWAVIVLFQCTMIMNDKLVWKIDKNFNECFNW